MPLVALIAAVAAVVLFVADAIPSAADTRGHRLASWGLALMSSAFILTFCLEAERITFGG